MNSIRFAIFFIWLATLLGGFLIGWGVAIAKCVSDVSKTAKWAKNFKTITGKDPELIDVFRDITKRL